MNDETKLEAFAKAAAENEAALADEGVRKTDEAKPVDELATAYGAKATAAVKPKPKPKVPKGMARITVTAAEMSPEVPLMLGGKPCPIPVGKPTAVPMAALSALDTAGIKYTQE